MSRVSIANLVWYVVRCVHGCGEVPSVDLGKAEVCELEAPMLVLARVQKILWFEISASGPRWSCQFGVSREHRGRGRVRHERMAGANREEGMCVNREEGGCDNSEEGGCARREGVSIERREGVLRGCANTEDATPQTGACHRYSVLSLRPPRPFLSHHRG